MTIKVWNKNTTKSTFGQRKCGL